VTLSIEAEQKIVYATSQIPDLSGKLDLSDCLPHSWE
jgi:hypothetical protein